MHNLKVEVSTCIKDVTSHTVAEPSLLMHIAGG